MRTIPSMPRFRPRLTIFVASAMLVAAAGCGVKRPTQVFPPASSRDAVQQARDMLDLYAAGQSPGSEAEGFPALVAAVSAVDAPAAAVLEKGLAEIAARPASARDTARRLLAELPASAAAASRAAGHGPAP